MLTVSHAVRGCALATLVTAALAAQTPPRFTLTRDLRIDAGTANLSPVTFLAVSGTGTIVVGQDQDKLIRFFGPRGQSLGTFGKAGAGPGEFRGLNRYMVNWIADTLAVGDHQLNRFVLITPDRKLLRTISGVVTIKVHGDSVESDEHIQLVEPVVVGPDGSQLLYTIVSSTLETRPTWARDAAHLDTKIALINASATGVFQRLISFEPYDDCGWGMTVAYSMCGRPILGVDPVAEHFAWVAMSYSGVDSGTFKVQMSNHTGALAYSRSYPFTAQPIPAHIRDSIATSARKEVTRTTFPRLWARFPPPAIYPGVEAIVVGSDGSAWVQLRATPAGTPWVMLSPRGDVTGTVLAPSNVKIMVLGNGVVWGTEKDADDLESVVRYRVTRGGAQ